MKTKCLMPFAALVLTASLAACGGSGDGGGDAPRSEGSDSSRQVDGGVPSQARADGTAFITWLKTVLSQTDPQAEPLQIDGTNPLPVDESAEPISL